MYYYALHFWYRHDYGRIRFDCLLQPQAKAPDVRHAADRLRSRPAHAAYAHAWGQHGCHFQCYFPQLAHHGTPDNIFPRCFF